MKLKIRNGIIYNADTDETIGTIGDSEEAERIIELGSEAVPEIERFIAEVRSGTFKPRMVTRRFEALLEKYAV